ncbi:RNA polymerase sigma factor [Lactobacillus sp. 3B(2020)]|uniref:RNA polymerase sigma factor n=1 Tax=Lactobacillus sp. 3B(2020) TaxID=2695882 RepID=UPI0015DD78AE|nr:sigma-70 family RNA polymerase sigma factor [Lactobacillus sp. 3B(2020)]QLL70630.1 sigma-70 family RNA polymerase sigma factor [Lactobacillus sp. 3B(2020)]
MKKPEKKISEQKLIYMVRNHHDDASFEMLFRRYLPMVHKLRRKYTGLTISYEDWHQEAGITLFKCLKTYDEIAGAFATYYRKMLLNRLNDLYRSQQTQKRMVNTKTFSLDQMPMADQIEDERVASDKVVRFRIALNKLTTECSKFELLCFLKVCNGMSLEEVAAELQKDPRSVYSAIWRVERKFLRILDQEWD